MNPAHSPLTGAVPAVGEVCRSVGEGGVAVLFGAVKNRFLQRIRHLIRPVLYTSFPGGGPPAQILNPRPCIPSPPEVKSRNDQLTVLQEIPASGLRLSIRPHRRGIRHGAGAGRIFSQTQRSPGGLLSMLFVSTLIWCIVCVITFELARSTRTYDYRNFMRGLLGRAWPVYRSVTWSTCRLCWP